MNVIQNRAFSKIHRLLSWIFVILICSPACNLATMPPEKAEATLAALQAQQTRLAQTQQALTQPAAPTLPLLQVTDTPTPTSQPTAPTAAPLLVAPPLPVDDGLLLERKLQSAKILLFEDMSASLYLRYAKEALDRAGYFYQDVGSAKGWFKNQLLSQVEWDLVIAAAEARRDFGGEFFDYLDKQVGRGASLIVEYWDWDAAPAGMQQALLDRCGVEFDNDWFEPDMRVFFWLAPESPLLRQPNPIPSALRNSATLWRGDLGDQFRIRQVGGQPSGDAQIIAGTYAGEKSEHGVLVSCLQGRVILQSFSSHEYEKEGVIALWQNYIYQTLLGRLAAAPSLLDNVPGVFQAAPAAAAEIPAASAGLGQEAVCSNGFAAQVAEPPLLQEALFEHHAAGTFLTVALQLKNAGLAPLFIWDQDYSLEGTLAGRPVVYTPHKAATGYLYISNGGNLVQDLLPPGAGWRTNLAFDVDKNGVDWVLVVRPGAEIGQPGCEVRISLGQ